MSLESCSKISFESALVRCIIIISIIIEPLFTDGSSSKRWLTVHESDTVSLLCSGQSSREVDLWVDNAFHRKQLSKSFVGSTRRITYQGTLVSSFNNTGRYSLVKIGESLVVTISRINLTEAGEYLCRSGNTNINSTQLNVLVNVTTFENITYISTVVGDDTTLPCRAFEAEWVKWIYIKPNAKSQYVIRDGMSDEYVDRVTMHDGNKTSSRSLIFDIVVEDTQLNDAGWYVCIEHVDENLTWKHAIKLEVSEKVDYTMFLTGLFIGISSFVAFVGISFIIFRLYRHLRRVKPNSDNVPSNDSDKSYTMHKVEPGDTLISIAIRYGTTWQKIQEDNKIKDENYIYIGQKLKIWPLT